MKKLLLSLSVIALSVSGIKAQGPSYDLDTWTNVQFSTTVQDPVGWASFNVLTSLGMAQSVYKVSNTYQGPLAAKIVTQKIQGATVPGYDTVGLLVLGSVQVFPTQAIKYGTAFTGRPSSFSFATKYAPVSLPANLTDTGSVIIQLTKWNTTTNKADTIASGKWSTTALDTASWTLQTINLASSYTLPAVSPDTLKIYCSSSSLLRPNIGSALWVDDFTYTGWVSTNDIAGVKNSVSTYPNPAVNKVTVECTVNAKTVEVMDITGKKIGSYQMNNNKAEIATSDFAKGIYLYNVIDAHNAVLNRGKFEVSK